MNWGRGFFRLWIFTTLFWIALVAVLFRPDALMSLSDAQSHEVSKTSQNLASRPDAGIQASVGDRVPASLLAPGDTAERRDTAIVLLGNDSSSGLLRDRLLKFAVAALIPPWVLLLFGFSVAWVIRGFGSK